jgi:alkaline phosphatase
MRKALFLILASLLLLAACAAEEAPKASPPHIILFIGDGMGYGSELAASRYLYGSDDGLAWRNFPFLAWATTWSIDAYDKHAATAGKSPYDEASFDPSLGYDSSRIGEKPWPLSSLADDIPYLTAAVTDSAAAATAMSTGSKTKAGCIAWSGGASGGELQTLPELMRSRLGSMIGVVTTVPFDHATPASFVAHASERSDYASLAAAMTLGSFRPDVMIGGGHPDWCASYFSLSSLEAARSSALWTIAERRAGLDGERSLAEAAASDGSKGLFGLFGGADGAFEAPVPNGSFGALGLPVFTRNSENPSLASCVVAAARRMASAPGGFFLMAEQGDIDWANHANDLPRMLGAIYSLDEAVRAAIAWVNEPGDDVDWGNTLIIVTADHATGLPRFDLAQDSRAGRMPTLAYSTTGHGNELVTLAAIGDRATELFSSRIGVDRPGTRILDDTDVYRVMRAFAGL